MVSVIRRLCCIVALLPAVTACGGGGGGGGSGLISTPPPPPTSTPVPPPTPTGAILPAVQTAAPASPVASGATPNFSALGQTTQFPLLMTAIDGTFGGDATTTNAGGVLTADPDGSYRISINNPAVAISNVPVISFPGSSQGNFNIVATVSSGDLDYTRYGYWLRFQPTEGLFQAGAFTAGYLTPTNDIPTQGTASYSGVASGVYNEAGACNCGDQFVSSFTGSANLTANFSQLSLSGSITNIQLTSLGVLQPGAVNNIGFTASIDRINNLFAGTTSVTSQPAGAWAFGPGASGAIRGRFYGPDASEVGAVFSLSDGLKRLIGSIGASRNP